jgi:hypothetical protein
LSVKGEIIQCFHYASNAKSCYRVAIQETTEVPLNSENFISGKPIFRSKVGLVESNEKLVEKNGLLVARSIVNPEMDNIPLRIINVNLYGNSIARFSITCIMKTLNYLPLD